MTERAIYVVTGCPSGRGRCSTDMNDDQEQTMCYCQFCNNPVPMGKLYHPACREKRERREEMAEESEEKESEVM